MSPRTRASSGPSGADRRESDQRLLDIVDGDPQELQSAIDITLQRFAEYQSLQGAFGRRAVIEQAKGILMARHLLDAERAFDMLRNHSQHDGRKLVDTAQAVVGSHLLLLPPPPEAAAVPEPGS